MRVLIGSVIAFRHAGSLRLADGELGLSSLHMRLGSYPILHVMLSCFGSWDFGFSGLAASPLLTSYIILYSLLLLFFPKLLEF